MRIPWLHGEAPGDSLSKSLICPLLQDEDPALIQGPSPKIWGTPAGKYTAPLWMDSLCQGVGGSAVSTCRHVMAFAHIFSPLVGMVFLRWYESGSYLAASCELLTNLLPKRFAYTKIYV